MPRFSDGYPPIDRRKHTDCKECPDRGFCKMTQNKHPRVLALFVDIDESYIEPHYVDQFECFFPLDSVTEKQKISELSQLILAIFKDAETKAKKMLDEFEANNLPNHKIEDE